MLLKSKAIYEKEASIKFLEVILIRMLSPGIFVQKHFLIDYFKKFTNLEQATNRKGEYAFIF